MAVDTNMCLQTGDSTSSSLYSTQEPKLAAGGEGGGVSPRSQAVVVSNRRLVSFWCSCRERNAWRAA